MEARAVFSSRYAGSVGYYAAMLQHRHVAIDVRERFNKHQHALNRLTIVAVNGVQQLTASLVKPNRDMTVSDVLLSDHGNWRHNHWATLFSAYGRTPFFDYFADDLQSILQDESITTIASLNRAIHAAVVEFLDLDIVTDYIDAESVCNGSTMLDLRDGKIEEPMVMTYYQIWADRYGFRQGMSILDLLFNEGREAVLRLRQLQV